MGGDGEENKLRERKGLKLAFQSFYFLKSIYALTELNISNFIFR